MNVYQINCDEGEKSEMSFSLLSSPRKRAFSWAGCRKRGCLSMIGLFLIFFLVLIGSILRSERENIALQWRMKYPPHPTAESCFKVEVLTLSGAKDICDRWEKQEAERRKWEDGYMECDHNYKCYKLRTDLFAKNIPTIWGEETSKFYCAMEEESVIIKGYHYNKTECGPEVVVPYTIEGRPVVAIGKNAFRYGDYEKRYSPDQFPLTSLQLPEKLVWIDAEAFFGNHISGTLRLPYFLRLLSWRAFMENHLEKIIFNPSLRHIDGEAFRGNLLTEVKLPSTLEDFFEGAFKDNQIKAAEVPYKVYKRAELLLNNGRTTPNPRLESFTPEIFFDTGVNAQWKE